ncbi:MAG: lysoplasmalogenase [Bacteroidales bacterium]|nr:lysoplasmalogenase [Bacteroidales bacterium]
MKRNNALHLLFLVIVILELTGTIIDNASLEFSVKPLIMVWIGTYFLLNRTRKDFTLPVLSAFFFSWLGDIFLMFSDARELFFYAGVGGFFLSQLFYIYVFYRYYETDNPGFIRRKPLFILIFVAYLAGIYGVLYPSLEAIMKPVVLVYAISLIAMSVFALNRHGRVAYKSYLPVFLGSLFFVLSDSLLAINKFSVEIPLAGFLIMLAYISAQYLIMRGLILQKNAGVHPS